MGEIPRGEEDSNSIRALARLVEPIHTVCYYAPEVSGFTEAGFKGWWHAYFAYRSAPMGRVSAATVTAAFYNFSPTMVGRAVPSGWDIMEPRDLRAKQVELTGQALNRSLGEFAKPEVISQAATTLRKFADRLPIGARPLYAAWASEQWPTGAPASDDLMTLWHGCTLLREFRFDGHNIALAANELDPVECHVMMVTHGHGNAATIQNIRGWTEDEWDAACERLRSRGWIDKSDTQTEAGIAGRKKVEADTDDLGSAVTDPSRGGIDETEMSALLQNLAVVLEHLISTGEVSGVWPPPHVIAKG